MDQMIKIKNEKEIKSEVNVKHAGNGFLILIEDQFTKNNLAVTREELEKIVLGRRI